MTQNTDQVARALAQLNTTHIALFFSLCDAILYPGKCTPQHIASFLRENYKNMGDARNDAGDILVGFLVSKLENAAPAEVPTSEETNGGDRAL